MHKGPLADKTRRRRRCVAESRDAARPRVAEAVSAASPSGHDREELLRSLSLVEAALESTADGIMVADAKGRMVRFNRKFVEMWRLPERIATSMSDEDALRAVLDQLSNPEAFLAKVRELYGRPEATSFDALTFKDGRVFERYSQPQRIGDAIVGRVWSFRDVTERKRMEEALRQSEERLGRVVVDSPSPLILFAEDGAILQVSRSWYEITGYTPDELKTIDDWTERAYGERKAYVRAGIDALYDLNHRVNEGDFTIRAKDGTTRIWEFSSGPLGRLPDGRRLVLSVANDVTERRRAEEALRRSRDELEQRVAERTAQLTAANVELRQRSNQLVRLAAELTTAEQRERRRLAEILHEHLQQLLFAARMQTHSLRKQTKTPRLVKTAEALCATVDEAFGWSRRLVHDLCPPALLQRDLAAAMQWLGQDMQQRHGLAVQVETRGALDHLPELLIALLYKAAQELLFNVVKHAGLLQARLRLTRRGGEIQLDVADRGAGFDPAAVLNPSQRRYGFGLFSIRERVELLGGHLNFDCTPGRGSRIALTVPLPERAAGRRVRAIPAGSPGRSRGAAKRRT